MTKTTEEVDVFYPETTAEWREWLKRHHRTKQSVRLVMYKKSSDKPTVTWSQAVDVALCFGWIDSKKISIDGIMSHQYFSKRKVDGTWSKINKDKVKVLTEAGLMEPAGLEAVRQAQENGSWNILDEVEALVVPEDLRKALKERPQAEAFYSSLSKSTRKGMLQWVLFAKRPETRNKRIDEIARLAADGKKPKQF